jgi:hypothetical protein
VWGRDVWEDGRMSKGARPEPYEQETNTMNAQATCQRCAANVAGLSHPHNCPGPAPFDWDAPEWDN